MKLYLICSFLLAPILIYGQSISNVSAYQQGENVIINYDLSGQSDTEHYIKAFYSIDNGVSFSPELTAVSGDIKNGVKPGTAKKIVWEAKREVNSIDAKVIFKVQAEERKAMPKPFRHENIIFEIINAKKTSDGIEVEFAFTQDTDEEVEKSYLWGIEVIDPLGNHVVIDNFLFASYKSQNSTIKGVKCIKGVPMKGSFVLPYAHDEKEILAVTVEFGTSSARSFSENFAVKNIPVR